MAGLQRSSLSFRRQGSSGLVWDDKFLSQLNKLHQESLQKDIKATKSDDIGGLLDRIKAADPAVDEIQSPDSKKVADPAVDDDPPMSPRVRSCCFGGVFCGSRSK